MAIKKRYDPQTGTFQKPTQDINVLEPHLAGVCSEHGPQSVIGVRIELAQPGAVILRKDFCMACFVAMLEKHCRLLTPASGEGEG